MAVDRAREIRRAEDRRNAGGSSGAQGPAGPVGPPPRAGLALKPGQPVTGADRIPVPGSALWHELNSRTDAEKMNGAQDYMAGLLSLPERAKYTAAAAKRTAAIKEAQAQAKRLAAFAKLRLQGPEGIRAQQALLSQKGHAVTIDGKYGPQTQAALSAYLAEEQAKLSKGAETAYDSSSPVTIRAAENARLEKHVDIKRDFLENYAQDEINAITEKLAARPGRDPGNLTDDDKKQAQALRGYENFLAALRDPIKGMDNVEIDEAFQALSHVAGTAENAAIRKKIEGEDHGSLWSKKRWLDAAHTVVVEWALEPFTDVVGSALAAGFVAQEYGLLKSNQALLGSVGNLVRIPFTDISLGAAIAPAGSDARKVIEDTNTRAERDALVQSGDLLSSGQALLGDYTPEYEEKYGAPRWKAPQLNIGGLHLYSGALDFALIFANDPTIAASSAFKAFSLVGDVAAARALREASPALVSELAAQLGSRAAANTAIQHAGRRAWLDMSVNGRILASGLDAVVDDLARTGTPQGMRAAIPGLPEVVAAKAIKARGEAIGGPLAGKAAAMKVIEEAFVAGIWNPKIGGLRQLLNASSVTARVGPRLKAGRKAVAVTDRLTWVRALAAPKGPTASAFEREATSFVSLAIETAANAGNKTWRAAWNDHVKDSVHGLDLGGDAGRFYRLADEVAELDNVSLSAAFEGVVRPFMANPASLQKIPLGSYLEAIFSQPGFEESIRKLEVAVAIIKGSAGEAAAKQFIADLERGFLINPNFGRKLTTTAAKNIGLKLGGGSAKGVTVAKIEAAILELPEELQGVFRDRLAKVKGKVSGLGTLSRDINLATFNRDLQAEMLRILQQTQGRQVAALGRVGESGLRAQLRKPASWAAKRVLDVAETVPPSELKLAYKTENAVVSAALRQDGVTRWAAAFHIPAVVQNRLVLEASQAESEEALFKLTERMALAAMDAKGIEQPKAVLEIIRSQGRFRKLVATNPIRSVDELGNPVDDLQALSQRIESVRMFKPADLAAAVRKAILDGAQDASIAKHLAANLKVNFDKIGNFSIHITRADGTTHSLKSAAHAFHRFWKLLVVTNAAMPIVGATVGFIGTDGDLGDKLKGAGLGLAIGAVAGTRYVIRVVGIEDRSRMFLHDGFNADLMIPGYAKIRRMRYNDPLRRTMSDDITRIGNYGVSHFENDMLVHLDPDWGIIPRNHSRAPDAWYRIVNHQIHPESDPVVATLLREQAGHMTTAEADDIIKAFFKTEEGKLWKSRWAGALNGTSKTKDAVARMRGFLQRYSTPELAQHRVAGGALGRPGLIDRAHFKRLIKAGVGPDEFHAQQVWKLPRNVKDLFRAGSTLTGRLILSGPANVINRGPWHRSLFAKEYDRLVLAGVDREAARSIADDLAQRTVNSVLDNNLNSRFAAKVDIFAPFQHAREDTLASYVRLAIANPDRAMRVGATLARAFNNGEENGMFVKNEFTGQWQMTIPGSARLASALGLPGGLRFDANIKDLFFVGQGAYGVGVLPSPGGPFWSVFTRELANHYPDLFSENKAGGLQEFLFGYGPQGNLMRKDTSRLWMAFTGDTPPWEFNNQEDWKNQLNRWQHEVGQELIYQAALKGKKNYMPSKEELDEAVGKFFKAWAFFGTTFPASSFPVLTGRSSYFAASNAYHAGGLLPYDPEGFLKAHPEFEAYAADGSVTKYIGPDDVATLKKLRVGNFPESLSTFNEETGEWEFPEGSAGDVYERENTSLNQKLGYRRYESWAEFKDQFKTYKRTGEYYRRREWAFDTKDLALKERRIVALNQKYSDVVTTQLKSYDIRRDIHDILDNYPKQLQDSAFQRVRLTHGLSNLDLRKSIHNARNDPTWEANPWVGARTGLEIDEVVKRKIGNRSSGGEVERFVAGLSPAEQANYWRYQVNAIGNDPDLDNPQSILDRHKYYKAQSRAVWNAYPGLRKADTTWVNPFTKYVDTLKDDTYEQVSAAYDLASRLRAELDVAYNSQNWTAYNALKVKQTQAYDLVAALRDKYLTNLPDLTKYYEDLHAATLYDAAGNHAAADDARRMALMDKVNAPYVLTNEQSKFHYMPPAVQRAYVTDLVESLDQPPGKMPYDVYQYLKETKGVRKLFWDYLTPVQQAIMTAQFPNQIDAWKYQSEFYLRGDGRTGRSADGVWGKGAKLDPIPSELRYAHALLGLHDKRGGKSAPKAYAEYLELPNHPAVKAEFLAKHADVRDWMQLGPLANMDGPMRDFVTNTLVKYGDFGGGSRRGGSRSWYGVHPAGNGFNGDPGPKGSGYADFKWAKYQLYAWSQRDDKVKPATYDLWVNMPTGRDKKLYLEQHPEIGDWIRLGAMANMPEEYRNVVRSIMQQYGEWTEQQDPLGKTIEQFYATPGHGREQFLLNHPELEAYWALTRTPTEQAMFDLVNDYFAIGDIAARRAFMGAHPELQQHFLDSRSRRYERFLNQVAAYMGANPALFTDYLERQQDVLAELLRRYADPPMLREAGPLSVSTSTGGDRQRNTSRR